MPFDRKRLRIDGFDYSQGDYVYFATLCSRHQRNVFANEALAREVVKAIHWLRASGGWVVYCFCLMPDHLHLAVSPGSSGKNLSEVIASLKKWTTREAWKAGLQGQLWQRGWYDHVARREEDLVRICEYILDNPVRRGLVSDRDQWQCSEMPDALPS